LDFQDSGDPVLHLQAADPGDLGSLMIYQAWPGARLNNVPRGSTKMHYSYA